MSLDEGDVDGVLGGTRRRTHPPLRQRIAAVRAHAAAVRSGEHLDIRRAIAEDRRRRRRRLAIAAGSVASAAALVLICGGCRASLVGLRELCERCEPRRVALVGGGEQLDARDGVERLPFLGGQHEAGQRDVTLHGSTFGICATVRQVFVLAVSACHARSHSRYIDPLTQVWLGAARRIGLRVVRTPDAYAATDGRGTLAIGTTTRSTPTTASRR